MSLSRQEDRHLRVYMDACCYNRPFDDLQQVRVYNESEAVLTVALMHMLGQCVLIGSPVLQQELRDIKARVFYSIVRDVVPFSRDVSNRATRIQQAAGIKIWDSLHIAYAEAGNADIFLTTDDRLIKASARIALALRVLNPVDYVMEVLSHDRRS